MTGQRGVRKGDIIGSSITGPSYGRKDRIGVQKSEVHWEGDQMAGDQCGEKRVEASGWQEPQSSRLSADTAPGPTWLILVP